MDAPMGYWALHNQQCYQLHQARDGAVDLSPEMPATPSLSGSPVLSEFEGVTPSHLYHPAYAHVPTHEDVKFAYRLPMTPSDFGSQDESLYCSPQPLEIAYAPVHSPVTATSAPAAAKGSVQQERTHATSGRRRAQNRAAQRAFRERKEKHARDLETALDALNEKYQNLEMSHQELSSAYEKLRRTIELLLKDSQDDDELKAQVHSKDTLRKLLEIIHGEAGQRVATVKQEGST